MTHISPEAQAMIDRLARMDPANPHHDKAAIERILGELQQDLGMPARPLVWADDAFAGFEFVVDRACLDRSASFDPVWLAARAFGSSSEEKFLCPWYRPAVRIPDRARAILDACSLIGEAWDNTAAAQDAQTRYEDVYGACMLGRPEWADSWTNAALDAANALHGGSGEIFRRFALSTIEAFEAGLFLLWQTKRDLVCVLRPSAFIQDGRLHRSDGPAVVWPSGEAYHFWHGVHVPGWIVEESHRITVGAIREEPNQEIRRCMTEIYGRSRYLRDAGARLVHQDQYGKLWETQIGEETWRFVEVENGTPEVDGTRRTYTLDITDAAEVLGWPIETARAAVAATYGLRPEEYRPEVRT